MALVPAPNRSLPRWAGLALVLLAALLALVPELRRGCSCGHDFDFHLLSWMDALRAWRAGIPYPHWTPSANYGAGEPRFVFYPPLTWMLGAALGAVFSWQWVPVALTFLLLAATGLGARTLAREWLEEAPATLAGAIAIFSGYALFTAYERTAFAELSGGFWIALVLKFALRRRSCAASPPGRALDGSAVWLALSICGAWLSNPTVAVMACYLLAAVALVAALAARTWTPVVRAALATPLGLGLAALYLAPVAGEQRWADLNQVNESPGQMLENNWLFSHHADPVLAFHDMVLRQVSSIAVAMIALTLLSALLCLYRKNLPGQRAVWLPLVLIPLAVLFLLLPASRPVWELLPKLRYLQFPWRWLIALEAPLGLLLASAIWPGEKQKKTRIAVVALACFAFAGLTLAASRSYFQPCADEDAPAAMQAAWSSGAGYRGMDEYIPFGADNELLATGLPGGCLVANAQQPLGAPQPQPPDAAPDDDPPPPLWLPAQGSCLQTFAAGPQRARHHAEHFELRGTVPQPGFVILRLRRYPAWRILVNGQPAAQLPERADGLLAVPVAAGPLTLTADWMATPDLWLGRIVSLVSVLLLTALWLLERNFNRPEPRLV